MGAGPTAKTVKEADMELTLSRYHFSVTVRKTRSPRRRSTDGTPLQQPTVVQSDGKGQHLLASGSRHLLPMR
jgi:hypothetical protein